VACSMASLRCNCCKYKNKKKMIQYIIQKLYYYMLYIISSCCYFVFLKAFERKRNIVYTKRRFQRFTQRQFAVSKNRRRFCLLIFFSFFYGLVCNEKKRNRVRYTVDPDWIKLKCKDTHRVIRIPVYTICTYMGSDYLWKQSLSDFPSQVWIFMNISLRSPSFSSSVSSFDIQYGSRLNPTLVLN